MKKVLLGSLVVLFSLAVFTTTSCDEVDCTKKALEVTEAAKDFTSNPTSATCNAYKDALEDYIDCDGALAATKASYETALAALDCSLY